MPSTGWNVFVVSGVALVVYTAVRAEMILLGIIAGTLTFVTGWLLGYALNQDLLDSMESSRVLAAGGVTVFAIVWTLLYTQSQYILGLIVVCLVWFAAWFTSSMGPIKGDTGAMETIDEPRPAGTPEPGDPLDLGGPDDRPAESAGGGFLSGLFSFGGDERHRADRHAPEQGGGVAPSGSQPSGGSAETTATDTADTDPATEQSGHAEGSRGSIFGLGIFYEGDPGPSAGATEERGRETESRTATNESKTHQPSGATEAPDGGGEQASADHRRPGATRTGQGAGNGPSQRSSVQTSPGSQPETATGDLPSQRRDTRTRKQREPVDSPGRSTTERSPEGYTTYRGSSGDGADAEVESRVTAEGPGGNDPPEEHRVDVDESDGFLFG